MIEKLGKEDGQSMDIVDNNIAQLKEIFPEVFAENKIDFEKLQALLGNYVNNDEDHYNFTWHGKRRAARLAQTPSTGTLRPCKEESVDWDTTQNLFIEGDNLEVLKLLQKSYHRQVKMIYIDPPYNTGNDFVYEDDFKDGVKHYLEMTGQLDGDGKRISTNSSSAGRYHTNWLNMMYPRLKLARNLLRDDGVIFISIDDNEQDNLKKLCNEVFGEMNFMGQIVWEKIYTTKNDSSQFSDCHEYILCYAKNADLQPIGLLPRTKEMDARYKNIDNDPRGPWKAIPLYAKGERKNGRYKISGSTGRIFEPGPNSHWLYAEDKLQEMIKENRIYFGKNGDSQPNLKRFLTDVQQGTKAKTLWFHKDVGSNDAAKREVRELFPDKPMPFDFPKPTGLIERMTQISEVNSDDCIVLDFFAGSGTTAHSIYRANASDQVMRKWILVQIPEETPSDSLARQGGFTNISQVSQERIRRAAKKIKEENQLFAGDLGFKVFKLDTSNIKPWDAGFDTLENDLVAAVDYIKQDRTNEDVLYELLLKYGLDLTVPIETRIIGGKNVYIIGMGALIVCLDKDVSMETVEGIGKLKEELSPEIMRVVFKDNGFKDDVVKTNAIQALKRFGIEDIKSL